MHRPPNAITGPRQGSTLQGTRPGRRPGPTRRGGRGTASENRVGDRATVHVTTAEFDEGVLISPSGRLDASNSDVLEDVLRQLLDDGHKVVVFDLARVPCMTSAGLRVLLMAARETRVSGGTAVVCNLDERLRTKLTAVGFDKVVRVRGSLEEALHAF